MRNVYGEKKMTKVRRRFVIGLYAVLLTAGLGSGWFMHKCARAEARRWRDTQRAGGIPRFWEKEDWITTTLMNPPGSRHAVVTDEGRSAFKYIERHGFAEDRDVPLRRNAHLRFFCLGDSVTFGVLSNEQSFPDLLEKLLNSSENSWQVVNAGKGGESTYTALLRFRYVVSSYEADGIFVGWFAGNEPIEMTREGVYTGPRLRRVANGWQALWEDDAILASISEADVNMFLAPLEQWVCTRQRVLPENEKDPMDFVREGSSQSGTLSMRYALYGGTSFISAFRFLRYKPGREANLRATLQDFVVRSLAVVRAFRNGAGEKLGYVVIPEACEVDMDCVRTHPDFRAMLEALDLNEEDLSIGAYLRTWFMDLLRHERVAYVDPADEMRRAARTAAVFRSGDMHPTRKGNLAIAEAMAHQLHVLKHGDHMREPTGSRAK